MLYELYNSKNGVIKSISIDLNKLDKDVKNHLEETLKGRVKVVDNKVIIKTSLTLDQLNTLNNGYNEFHSKFIVDNVISKVSEQNNGEE